MAYRKVVAMMIRICGALLIFIGCTSLGFAAAARHRTEILTVKSFLELIDHIIAEFSCKVSALPELCKDVADMSPYFRAALLTYASALESQIAPDRFACMVYTLERIRFPGSMFSACLKDLSRILGSFDMTGQLRELEGLHRKWSRQLVELTEGSAGKIRTYRITGACVGCVLAIVLV